jgi:hypothetical protein
MSERELTPSERDAFMRQHFHVGASGLIEERKSGGCVVSVGGHPAGWLREYRATYRALPAPQLAMMLARVDKLLAQCREQDRKLAGLGCDGLRVGHSPVTGAAVTRVSLPR